MQKNKTLNDLFEIINPSVCTELEQHNIAGHKQSKLTPTVVTELCKLLNLPIGEQFQLKRFATGRLNLSTIPMTT